MERNRKGEEQEKSRRSKDRFTCTCGFPLRSMAGGEEVFSQKKRQTKKFRDFLVELCGSALDPPEAWGDLPISAAFLPRRIKVLGTCSEYR